MTGRERFSVPVSSRKSASVLRSSGTKLMPTSRRRASRGPRRTTFRPPIEMAPALGATMPNSARKSARWPMPSSAPTPAISPAATANENDSRAPSTERPLAARRGGAARSMRAGFAGKVAASERPMTRVITSSSEMAAAAKLPTLRPLRRIVRASQKRRTSCIRWEMKTTVVPARRRRSTSAPSHATSLPESEEVGSSRRRTRGSRMTARAISIFCRTGRARAPTSADGSTPSTPIRARASRTRASAARRSIQPGARTGS